MTHRFSMSEIVEELRLECAMRRSVYGKRVAAGTMKAETAERKEAIIAEAARLLEHVQKNAALWKALSRFAQITQEFPEVQTVLEQFPDATISVRNGQGQLL